MVPVAIKNPFAFWPRSRKVSNPPAKLSFTGRIAQLNTRQALPAPEKVNMRVVESGNHTTSLQINDLCTLASQRTDRSRAACGYDAVITHRNRLHLRLRRILRPYLPVDRNHVHARLSQRR